MALGDAGGIPAAVSCRTLRGLGLGSTGRHLAVAVHRKPLPQLLGAQLVRRTYPHRELAKHEIAVGFSQPRPAMGKPVIAQGLQTKSRDPG